MPLSRREFLASLAGLTALATSSRAAGPPLPEGTYALAGNILANGSLLTGHAVLIRDGRIENVTQASLVADRQVLRLPTTTILPGIINAHCHRVHSTEARKARWLEHGVTSIGDTGSPLQAMALLAESPRGTTATAAYSGPMLTPPGGYPLPVHDSKHALAVPSPSDGEEAVRMLADRGATMIKLSFEPGVMPVPWPMFDPETARSICDTARRLGLTIRCHVEDLSGLEPALDAGVHTIEHVPYRWTRQGRPHPVLTADGTVLPHYRKLLERMARDRVILTPTLDVLSRTPWNGPALYEPVRTYHDMGGRIALGNDFPYRRTEAGMVQREMRLLARAGLDGPSVLGAATNGSAAACGFTDRGDIAPGMAADLLVVKGNPMDNVDTVNAPLHVVKDGVFIR